MTSIIAPFINHPLQHFMQMIKSPTYRQIIRLSSRFKHAGKGKKANLKAGGLSLTVPDAQAFLWDYQELFHHEIYKFVADNTKPRIIDCGANIGLSCLYFKSLYPESKIIAFEADPEIYRYLLANLAANDAADVEVVPKAVWSTYTKLTFSAQGGDAGRIDVGGDENLIEVEAVPLEGLLNEPVDLLKIDVEGAELDVLRGAGSGLRNCKLVFVEYHSFAHQRQKLAEILNLMAINGFRVHICPEYCSPTPFVARPLHSRMDLRLNMFFVRESNP